MSPTLTFHEHILEFRKRILWIFVALTLGGLVGFMVRVRIIKFIQKPLGYTLYYTNPAGSFNFEIKIALIISLFIGLPVIVYQVLRFIGPALSAQMTKKLMVKIIGGSFALASMGVVFGYYIIVPLSLTFFSKYSTAQLKPLISADSYLSYLTNNLIIFVLVFQIPLIILFINRMKPLKPKRMLHYQRHVIVGSFAIAIALPFTYDPISQFVVAIPIVFLYYLSVLFVWYANRHLSSTSDMALPAAAFPTEHVVVPETIEGHPTAEQTYTTRTSRRSIDGIINKSSEGQVTLTNKPLKSKAQETFNKQSAQSKQRLRHLGLSIDGILPMLNSTQDGG